MSEKKSVEKVKLYEDGSADLRLRRVRLSFPNLFHPYIPKGEKEGDGNEHKYGAKFLFPKDSDNFANAKKALDHCLANGFKGQKVASDKWFMRPCDSKAEEGVDGYNVGDVYVSAASKNKPVLVHKYRVNGSFPPLKEEDGTIYAGCYVNVTVRVWPQDNNWGKRVNASLTAVQFCDDGEPFGAAKANADSEFADIEDEDDSDMGI